MDTATGSQPIAWGTSTARWVLLGTVAGSALAFLDVTTVNVALPTIGDDLGTDIGGLQWVLNANTLALAALTPLGGSLADHFGRRRIYLLGIVWFAAAAMLCGLAPTGETLAVARGLQGIGGALLLPGSLAILQATFAPEARARAIGAWSGLTGIAAAIGPLAGGWLIDAASWRWIFFLNLPLAAVVVAVTVRHVPETRDPDSPRGFDIPGAVLIAAGLGSLSWGLISAGTAGFGASQLGLLLAGVVALAAFVAVQRRSPHPVLPLSLFSNRQFTGANAATLAVYAGLAGMMFLLIIYLQVVAGYSPIGAGAALLPVTVLMLAFSERAGALAERIGPRWLMTGGPLLMAAGMLLLLRISADASYWTTVLPAMVVYGAGVTLTVAPLTETVLASAPAGNSGVASAVNSAIARAAALLAVALLPLVAGITGDSYQDPVAFDEGFRNAIPITASLVAIGGLLSALLVRNHLAAPAPGGRQFFHCAVDAPPVEQRELVRR